VEEGDGGFLRPVVMEHHVCSQEEAGICAGLRTLFFKAKDPYVPRVMGDPFSKRGAKASDKSVIYLEVFVRREAKIS
jgi:hypothetical protein